MGHSIQGINQNNFLLPRSDSHAKCYVRINRNLANVVNREGMQVPCSLERECQSKYIDIFRAVPEIFFGGV